jgi:hypothetical protein
MFTHFAFELLRQFAMWLESNLEHLVQDPDLPVLRGPSGACRDRDVAALSLSRARIASDVGTRVHFQDVTKWQVRE